MKTGRDGVGKYSERVWWWWCCFRNNVGEEEEGLEQGREMEEE